MVAKPRIIGLFELIVWIAGLIYLAYINPNDMQHFTICPLSNLGIGFCPGCGLGLSISYIYNFEFAKSFQAHPIGIFAFSMILFRIGSIIVFNIKTIKVLKNKEIT